MRRWLWQTAERARAPLIAGLWWAGVLKSLLENPAGSAENLAGRNHRRPTMSENIVIFDTTMRDGEQSPGASMNQAEKLRIAHQLEKMGVDVMEAGFPIASPGDFEAVKTVAQSIKNSTVAGLARCNQADVERAGAAVAPAVHPRIHVFIATSPIHMAKKLQMDGEQVLEAVAREVARARNLCPDVEFSAEDASRSEPEFLARVIETAIKAGATTVNIPDTVGYALPAEYGALIRGLRETVPNADKAVWSVHCHNDLGLAVANTIAAIEAGARQVEVTINGIGERAGNAALEELVMLLQTRNDLAPYTTSVDSTQLYPASRMVSNITGIWVQPNKAIVGANAFAHESGVHQDGMLKDSSTYEIMRPEMVGLNSSNMVLGKHSGRHAFRSRLEERGYELNEEQVNELFDRFKRLADKRKEVVDEDLDALVTEVIYRPEEVFKLKYLNVMSGTHVNPVTTVGMEVNGEMRKEAGFGAGPVDAVYNTILKICGSKAELMRFTISAITGGTDAQGEVTVRLKENGYVVLGRAADPDILLSSAKALVDGMNRLAYMKSQPDRKRPQI